MISSQALCASLLLVAALCFARSEACKDDGDCAAHETCRRLCNFSRECDFVCVTSSVKARILQRRSHDGLTSTSTPAIAEEITTVVPFTATSNPFTDEFVEGDTNAATPQTFSEEEFERELRESSSLRESFASSPEAPPTTTDTSTYASTTFEAMPPSLVPEAPGFEEFKSGYTRAPPTTEDRKYPEEDASDSTSAEPSTTESEPPASVLSTVGLSTTSSWLITSTFAPALGVEKKENEVKDSGYAAEIGEISNAIVEEDNKTNIVEDNYLLNGPVAKEAYFGMAAATTTEIPTSTSSESTESEGSQSIDQGVDSSTTQRIMVHSTIIEVTRSTIESSTVTTTQSYADEAAVEGEEKKSSSECPPPVPCEKNCGVFIDEHGCQGCQCLWQTILCANDTDCVGDGLFCDDGRCECRLGFIQDMLQSGVCRSDPNFNDLKESNVTDQAVHHQKTISEDADYRRRLRRASFKPRRMERLQWPGPCDNDDHCPPNLYCLQGDCWHLPEKPIRALQHDPPPKSFPIEDSEDENDDPVGPEAASSVQVPQRNEFDFKLFPSPPPTSETSRSRFATSTESSQEGSLEASKSPSESTETLETTTAAPVTTTFPLNTVPFTKLIEVPDFLQTGRRKVRTRSKAKSRTVVPDDDDAEPPLDPIEFPISSRLQQQRLAKKKTTLRPSSTTSAPPVARTEFHGLSGVWHDMAGPDEYISKPAPDLPEDARVFLQYTDENRRRKPIRVEMYQAKSMVHDECKRDSDCGRTFVCCEKSWCDLTPECGKAKFCLPHCDMSKMTYLSSMGVGGMPLIDIIYD